MGVLEIIAEQRLGAENLVGHPQLRVALERAEIAARSPSLSDDEKERIDSIVELCFEYERETDPEEKTGILRTLEEISANEPLELPTKTLSEWHSELLAEDPAQFKAHQAYELRIQKFLKKYFSLRAKAGLATQSAVAKKSSLSRGYIAVIETGEHFPQQKTLQKLAKAFRVDVADLLP